MKKLILLPLIIFAIGMIYLGCEGELVISWTWAYEGGGTYSTASSLVGDGNVKGGWFNYTLTGGQVYTFHAKGKQGETLPANFGFVLFTSNGDLIGWSKVQTSGGQTDYYLLFGPNSSGSISFFADTFDSSSPGTSLAASGFQFELTISNVAAPTGITYTINGTVDFATLGLSAIVGVNVDIFDPMAKNASGVNYKFINADIGGLTGSGTAPWTGNKSYSVNYGATFFVMLLVDVANYPNGINNGDLFWSSTANFNFITSTFIDNLFSWDTNYAVTSNTTFTHSIDFAGLTVDGETDWIKNAAVQTYSGTDIINFDSTTTVLTNLIPTINKTTADSRMERLLSVPAHELSFGEIMEAYPNRQLPSKSR